MIKDQFSCNQRARARCGRYAEIHKPLINYCILYIRDCIQFAISAEAIAMDIEHRQNVIQRCIILILTYMLYGRRVDVRRCHVRQTSERFVGQVV